jgi:hypothetical protein
MKYLKYCNEFINRFKIIKKMKISLLIPVLLLLACPRAQSQNCEIAALEKLIKTRATEYYKGADEYFTMPVRLDYARSSRPAPENIASEQFMYVKGITLRFYLVGSGMNGDRLVGRLYKYDPLGKHQLIEEFYGSHKDNEITFIDYTTQSEDEMKLDIFFENGSKGCGLLVVTIKRLFK